MRRLARVIVNIEAVLIVGVMAKLHAAGIGQYDLTESDLPKWLALFVLLLCTAAYAVGLPDLPRNAYQAMTTSAVATIAVAVLISLIQLGLGSAVLPRFVVFWSAAFLVPGWSLASFVSARDRRQQVGRDRVLVVAPDGDCAALRDDLNRNPERRAVVVAELPPERGDLVAEVLLESRASVVVLGREAQANDEMVAAAAALHARGVRIRTLTLFYDEWLGKLPIGELERVAMMFDIGEVHRVRYTRMKRATDLVIAVLALLPLAVVIVGTLLGNVVGNRGPLLYRQQRVGKGGTPFTMLKLRTMRPDRHPSNDWTTEDDPRITPLGRWLRRTHLDELPQAVNLLLGDLTVVGPRPEQPHYVEDLTEKIRFYEFRHLVRPGITGWAQVKYRYGSSDIDAFEKLQYEFWYLRHQSFALDIRIIGRTLRSVVGRAGR